MKEKKSVSIVVPMYNEVFNVEPLLQDIFPILAEHFCTYEIVVVDDGSNDGTSNKLIECQRIMPELVLVRHKMNYGQSASIVTGARVAKYDWIVTLDGDQQNDPADIPLLFNELNKFPEDNLLLIVGNRKKRRDHWLKLISSRIANDIRHSLLHDDCHDSGCSLKLFSRDVFLQLPHFEHLHRFLPALFKRSGGEIINIPVNHRPRLHGQSKYGLTNRLWVGVVDLLGVVWLMRRSCNPEIITDYTE